MRVGAQAGWTTRAAGDDRLTLAVSRDATLSDNGNAASPTWGLRATFSLGLTIGPA